MSEAYEQRVRHFGTCFADMLVSGTCSGAPFGFGRESSQLAADWVHSGLRVMARGVDSAEAIRHECAALSLSPLFVDAVLSSDDGASERCAALSDDLEFARDDRLSRRVRDVAAALILGGKPVLCPFTGMRALVRDSLDLHTFLHRHGPRTCIILPDWRIDQCASDRCWFFPEKSLLLTSVPNLDGRTALIQTAARVMANPERVAAYLSDPDRSLLVSEDAIAHIGHYVWNVVSGWSRLFSLVSANRIDVVTSYPGWQVFGGVAELYPDELARVGAVARPTSQEALYDLILDQRATSLVLLDGHVTTDAAERIVGWSRKRCSSAFHADVQTLRDHVAPLVMVTIRTENRAWVEQRHGLACLINELARDHPRLGIVLDGLNAGIRQEVDHGLMSLSNERSIAASIIEACPTVRIYDSIGCSPHESVVLAATVDAFLAPVGAGLAKTRWIANKPGVAFSNTTFMQPGNYDGFLYDRFRDDIVPMRYVSRADVQDVEAMRHGEPSRANFSMPWQSPLRELRALLRTL